MSVTKIIGVRAEADIPSSTIAWVASHQCLLVYCLQSLSVKVVELRDGQIQHKKTLKFRPANERFYKKIVRSAENGRIVLCGSDRGVIRAWDLQTGQELPAKLELGRGRVAAYHETMTVTRVSRGCWNERWISGNTSRRGGLIRSTTLLNINVLTYEYSAVQVYPGRRSFHLGLKLCFQPARHGLEH